jgi:triacylglycerol lipase
MYPGSSFLRTLATGDETPGSVRYATWYSPCDGIIIPYNSTVLGGATNNYVACESHLGFLSNTTILSQVRGFMG